ncbi:hypothetical protein OG21DRAFT_1563459 [Imleria badia]|nr:hypothetical protein OG21DRAFT_1563459 [Imleria badia]
MANMIRSAKSGSDWTRNELAAYHIECHSEDPLTFFGVQVLPQPQADLSSSESPPSTRHKQPTILYQLDTAMTPCSGDSAVHDFVAELFRALGYAKHSRVACTRRTRITSPPPLEDEGPDPEAQLIAAAIAAFETNNEQRVKADEDLLEEKISPRVVFSVAIFR